MQVCHKLRVLKQKSLKREDDSSKNPKELKMMSVIC